MVMTQIFFVPARVREVTNWARARLLARDAREPKSF